MQTFLIKTNINWGLRNEIRLLYQPRNNHPSISHSSFNTLPVTTFLIQQIGQIKDRFGKNQQLLFNFWKSHYPKESKPESTVSQVQGSSSGDGSHKLSYRDVVVLSTGCTISKGLSFILALVFISSEK